MIAPTVTDCRRLLHHRQTGTDSKPVPSLLTSNSHVVCRGHSSFGASAEDELTVSDQIGIPVHGSAKPRHLAIGWHEACTTRPPFHNPTRAPQHSYNWYSRLHDFQQSQIRSMLRPAVNASFVNVEFCSQSTPIMPSIPSISLGPMPPPLPQPTRHRRTNPP